jgi:hypothetical protein
MHYSFIFDFSDYGIIIELTLIENLFFLNYNYFVFYSPAK